jgi:diadenosine tetraphosphate (Ap4A) HIT family hydrolase
MNVIFPKDNIMTTKLFNAGQDWETPIPGFFILSPLRKGIRSVTDLTEKESIEFIQLIRRIRKGMREALNIDDVYLFQNEDTEHGFHLWMFPRHKWMDKFGRKIQSVRNIMNYSVENMNNDKSIREVKDCVKKMKEYLSKN